MRQHSHSIRKKKYAFLICGMKIDKKFRCLKLTIDVIKNQQKKQEAILNESQRIMPEYLTVYWSGSAITETIASETLDAIAYRRVIHDSTFSVGCTSARAWIDTFLIDAGLVRGAIRAHDTFRSTVWCRTNHARHASTLGLTRNHLAL